MKGKRFAAIEGFRFLACAGVLLCHFKGLFYPSLWPAWLLHTPLKVMVTGIPFVRFFLTLSGFLTAYKYYSRKNYEEAKTDVFLRYLRLMPMAAISIFLMYLLMKAGLVWNGPASALTGAGEAMGAFNSFPPMLASCLREGLLDVYIGRGSTYMPQFWTLEYEFLGVLFVLAILCIFREHPARIVIYAVLLLLCDPNYGCVFAGMAAGDIAIHTKLPELIQRHGLISFAVLLITFCFFAMTDLHDENRLWILLFEAALSVMTLLLAFCPTAEKLLGGKAFVFGGRLSYGVYAMHWPVLISLICGLYVHQENRSLPFMVMLLLLSFVVTFAVSFALTVLTEKISAFLAERCRKLMFSVEKSSAKM